MKYLILAFLFAVIQPNEVTPDNSHELFKRDLPFLPKVDNSDNHVTLSVPIPTGMYNFLDNSGRKFKNHLNNAKRSAINVGKSVLGRDFHKKVGVAKNFVIRHTPKSLTRGVRSRLNTYKDFFNDYAKFYFNGSKDYFNTVKNKFKNLKNKYFDKVNSEGRSLKDKFNKKLNSLKDFGNLSFNDYKEKLKKYGNYLKDSVDNIKNKGKNEINKLKWFKPSEVIKRNKDMFKAAYQELKDDFEKNKDRYKSNILNYNIDIPLSKKEMVQKYKQLKGKFTNKMRRLKRRGQQAWNKMYSGKNLKVPSATGMKQKLKNYYNTFKNKANEYKKSAADKWAEYKAKYNVPQKIDTAQNYAKEYSNLAKEYGKNLKTEYGKKWNDFITNTKPVTLYTTRPKPVPKYSEYSTQFDKIKEDVKDDYFEEFDTSVSKSSEENKESQNNVQQAASDAGQKVSSSAQTVLGSSKSFRSRMFGGS